MTIMFAWVLIMIYVFLPILPPTYTSKLFFHKSDCDNMYMQNSVLYCDSPTNTNVTVEYAVLTI